MFTHIVGSVAGMITIRTFMDLSSSARRRGHLDLASVEDRKSVV